MKIAKSLCRIFTLLIVLPSVVVAENLDLQDPLDDPINTPIENLDDNLEPMTAETNETDSVTHSSVADRMPSQETLNVPVKDNANGAQPSDVALGKTFWSLTDDNWGLQTGTGALVIFPARVAKTGQTITYATEDDGDHQKGATVLPRFTDNDNGTISDNLTGLIWIKNANCLEETKTWKDALYYALILKEGTCGLSDGSRVGDWRIPNIKEFQSLIDFSKKGPALPDHHPFVKVQSSSYWSATTRVNDTTNAWIINIDSGFVNHFDKSFVNNVWPVRGGQ